LVRVHALPHQLEPAVLEADVRLHRADVARERRALQVLRAELPAGLPERAESRHAVRQLEARSLRGEVAGRSLLRLLDAGLQVAQVGRDLSGADAPRSEEHTSELQSRE